MSLLSSLAGQQVHVHVRHGLTRILPVLDSEEAAARPVVGEQVGLRQTESYKLQVTSYKLQVTSCKLSLIHI